MGGGTYNAVVSFQTTEGLTVDGIVGTNSWKRIGLRIVKEYYSMYYTNFTYNSYKVLWVSGVDDEDYDYAVDWYYYKGTTTAGSGFEFFRNDYRGTYMEG